MLKKANISPVKMYIENSWEYRKAWKLARLGKFTSSRISVLCGERGIGDGGMSYILERVGEELCGYSSDPEIDTDATRHGAKYESEALWKFKNEMGCEFIVTQQFITVPGSRFGSTPDGIILVRESLDGSEYEAKTIECKCFPSFRAYIGLALCNTPKDVKDYDRKIYFQVLDQLDATQSNEGYLVAYHPDFKMGNLNIVHFVANEPVVVSGKKTYPIHEDLKLLRERKATGLKLFYEIRDKMLLKGRF
jgi:hypothetical protein